jgi:hypothetical protein
MNPYKHAGSPPPKCSSDRVIISQRVFRAENGEVGFRFTFCCVGHAPLPWLEVQMTPEGALRFAGDITAAAKGD